MKKKFLSFIMLVLMTVTLVPETFAFAQTEISIGDYVQMGTYYGEPILWRCVAFDENGPLMLSDKILCLKAFDASGENISGSHGRGLYHFPDVYVSRGGILRKTVSDTEVYFRHKFGSNYWADSNIRSWLNSMSSAGEVKWDCGNPPVEDNVWGFYNDYANEAGFLNGFSSNELGAIKEVEQKSILDGYENAESPNTLNPNAHKFSLNIGDVLKNYETAYSEQIKDRVFLLDVKQLDAVYQNSAALGGDYYIGTPTQQCVEHSEYAIRALSADENWYYWLRTPDAQTESFYVRTVYSDGSVLSTFANNSIYGVRPAFYLNTASADFAYGDGTFESPYAFSEGLSFFSGEYEIAGNILSVLTSVSNKTEEEKEGTLIAAVYKDNKLCGISQKAVTIPAGETKDYDFDFDSIDADKIKLFLWDNIQGMSPLCRRIDLDVLPGEGKE